MPEKTIGPLYCFLRNSSFGASVVTDFCAHTSVMASVISSKPIIHHWRHKKRTAMQIRVRGFCACHSDVCCINLSIKLLRHWRLMQRNRRIIAWQLRRSFFVWMHSCYVIHNERQLCLTKVFMQLAKKLFTWPVIGEVNLMTWISTSVLPCRNYGRKPFWTSSEANKASCSVRILLLEVLISPVFLRHNSNVKVWTFS